MIIFEGSVLVSCDRVSFVCAFHVITHNWPEHVSKYSKIVCFFYLLDDDPFMYFGAWSILHLSLVTHFSIYLDSIIETNKKRT